MLCCVLACLGLLQAGGSPMAGYTACDKQVQHCRTTLSYRLQLKYILLMAVLLHCYHGDAEWKIQERQVITVAQPCSSGGQCSPTAAS